MNQIELVDFVDKNSRAEIVGFKCDTEATCLMVERLKEMGLYEGLMLEYLGQAPFGGPLLYRFSGTVVALRVEEARCLQVIKI